jgi:hypothetical protein
MLGFADRSSSTDFGPRASAGLFEMWFNDINAGG